MRILRFDTRKLLALLAVVIGLVMIFPIYLLVVSSMRSEAHVLDVTWFPVEFAWNNFKEAVQSTHLLRSIGNSLIVSVTVTVVAMIFHAMSGYALARLQFPGRKFVFAWMLSTLMVPFAVITIPLYLITKSFGMLDSYAGLIIPSIFNAYGIFLFRQFYRDFPKELEEAAYIEGLSIAGTFSGLLFLYPGQSLFH